MTLACAAKPTWLGRYAIFDEIAVGGMATVYLARLSAPMGFSRVVAIKRLHPHLLKNLEFKKMFVDEARLAARVRHPNVVPTLDVIVNDGEIVLVMEYVHGESLLTLRRLGNQGGGRVPLDVATAITINVLQGLHAAHEARDEGGVPLGIVHRDVSPHNVLLGADGVARVLDFGIAKAIEFQSDTGRRGMIKGKHSYMAPEVLRCQAVTRQADVFSAAVVFWELITGKKLFGGGSDLERMLKVLGGNYPPPSSATSGVPPAVDRIVMKGLAPDPRARYTTALEMAVELESVFAPASQRVVSNWIGQVAADSLEQREQLLQRIEVSEISPASAVPGESGIASYGSRSIHPAVIEEEGVSANRAPRSWLRLSIAAVALVAACGFAIAAATQSSGVSSTSPASSGPVAPASSPVLPLSPSAPGPDLSAVGAPPEPPTASAVRNTPTDIPLEASSVRSPSAQPPRRPARGNGNIKDFLPDEL